MFARAFLFVVVSLGFAFSASAQSTVSFGDLRGLVLDPASARVGGVAVVATEASSGLSGTVYTDSGGFYDFESIFPGVYNVTFSLSGYQTQTLSNVTIAPAAVVTRNVTLAYTVVTRLAVKSITPGTTIANGTPVTIVLTQTNISPYYLENVTVSGTGCASWTGTVPSLSPGQSADFTCTFMPNATISWTASGQFTVSFETAQTDAFVSAAFVPGIGIGGSAGGTITVIHPAVELTPRTVSPGLAVTAGTVVTVSVTATNLGDTPISNIFVSGTPCLSWSDGSTALAPGASTVFTCGFTPGVTATWTANLHGKDILGNDIPVAGTSASVRVAVLHPALSLTTKTISPSDTVPSGTNVSIVITATNTGDTTLANITVTGTGCTTWGSGLSGLSPGASADFRCNTNVTSQFVWSATVHGRETTLNNDVSATTGGTIDTIIPARLTDLNPGSRIAGTPAFTLTVNGSDFQSTGRILWNGQPLPTSFVSSTQLRGAVSATLITTSGTVPVTVDSNGVVTSPLTFTIARKPAIVSISPNAVAAGGPDFTLTLTGTDFTPDATIMWDGSPLTSTFVSATQMTAAVPARLIAAVSKATVTVAVQGVSSNGIDVEITALVITSVSPNVVTAGSSDFTMTVNGSAFTSASAVRWNGAALTTRFVNANQLTTTVSGTLVAAAGSAVVTVANQGALSNSLNVSIRPLLTSSNPASAAAGGPAVTLTLTGTGFVSPSTVLFNQTALQTTFVSSTQLTASLPAALTSAMTSAQLSVTSAGVTSNSIAFAVTQPAPPTITITGLQSTPVPTEGTTVGIQLGSASTTVLEGTLTLSFRPAAGLPPNYTDPFLQFASGGTVLNFTIPAGATAASLPQNGAIQQGTVAGDIVVTLTRLVAGAVDLLPQPAPTRTVTVARLVPVVTPNSVRIVNVTSNSLEVEATAYSTPLDLVNATYTFEFASGVQVVGSTSVSVDLRNAAVQWYSTSQFGGLFRLRVVFPIEGDPNFVQRVSLTIANSAGNSTAVSGGK